MDALAELRALDTHRVLTPGSDPRWDRVFTSRPDVSRIELDPEDYPTAYLTSDDPAQGDHPFPTPALRGALKELILSCWEEEGARRDELALDLLSRPLTPEAATHLAKGGFSWEPHELALLTAPGLLPQDALVHLVLEALDLTTEDEEEGAACLDVLRAANRELVDLVLQVARAYRGLGPRDAVRLVNLLQRETPAVVETFLVLHFNAPRLIEAEALEAARRV